jgi:hypothetical protein
MRTRSIAILPPPRANLSKFDSGTNTFSQQPNAFPVHPRDVPCSILPQNLFPKEYFMSAKCKNLKQSLLFGCVCFLVFLLMVSCAFFQPQSKQEDIVVAIREASDYINVRVPEGSKLAIISISSDYPLLSEYIIDSLMENIVNDNRFTVVDRRQLDAIRAELDFQMSGDVDDSTAQALGRLVGAQTIILGSISPFGSMYRLTVRALAVESAQVQGLFNRNIQTGETINTLTGNIQAASAASQAGTPALSANANNFERVLDGIKAALAGAYTITLTEDITLYEGIDFAGFGTKTITIQGDSQMRTITRSFGGSKSMVSASALPALFTIRENVVLILGNNVTLTESSEFVVIDDFWGEKYPVNPGSGVLIGRGGIFEMRNGSVIRDNRYEGVSVLGTFIMSGGTISGNYLGGVQVSSSWNEIDGIREDFSGTFTMSSGTISGNCYYSSSSMDTGSGGVNVNAGVFTISGGTISGNEAFGEGGGVYVSSRGTFTKTGGTIDDTNEASSGRVVFFGYDSGWVRNSTAGPSVNMDTRVSGRQGGWE